MTNDVLKPGSAEAVNEMWTLVPGYCDRYEVSNFGNVRSMNWEGNTGKIKQLSISIRCGPRNAVGYRNVRLHCNGKTKTLSVGRIVLETFVRQPEAGEEQNHKNGNTLDDRLINLEWVTRSENQKHAIRNGLASIPSRKNYGKRYVWENKDGRLFHGTPSMMVRQFCIDEYMDVSYLGKMTSPEIYPHYKSYKGWRIIEKPNPGSEKALRLSCCCPVWDNVYGEGVVIDGERVWWKSFLCPLHGMLKDEKETCEGKEGV